jgi:hypothetical protein
MLTLGSKSPKADKPAKKKDIKQQYPAGRYQY